MPAAKKQSRPEAAVTLDATFHRAVADKVIAIDLGRDVELAFLQAAPAITGVIDVDDETEQVRLQGGLSEVARIRVAGPVALAVAVNIIETLASAGKIRLPAFRESLGSIFENQTADETETSQ